MVRIIVEKRKKDVGKIRHGNFGELAMGALRFLSQRVERAERDTERNAKRGAQLRKYAEQAKRSRTRGHDYVLSGC